MCCESFCCPYSATLVNRDLIMMLYKVDFDPCDEYIITCVICLNCICTILACIDDSFENCKDITDILLAIIMSCSLAQQESTLDVMTGDPTTLGGNFTSSVEKQYSGNSAVQIGQHLQNNYAPQEAAYGQPQAVGYGQPQAVGYGQPQAVGYGQPVPQRYGQAATYGQPQYAQQPPQYGQGGVGFA